MSRSDPQEAELEGKDIPNKLYFRIGEVADIVGVEPHVLRYWEGEFRMRPHRSASGQRLYRKRDIARFLKIQKLLHSEGFTIAGARKALSGSGTAKPASKGDPAPSAIAVDVHKLRDAAQRIQALRGKLQGLREELDRMAPTAGA